ncbi:MAG: methionine biosynthesis protein MetW [Vampirovibrionales bacterium]
MSSTTHLSELNDTALRFVQHRSDLTQLFRLLTPQQTVLDLGCGEGDLLEALKVQGNPHTLGVEVDAMAVQACLAKGLTVYHGTLEEALVAYPDKAFNTVVLNQTLQRTANPVQVVKEMVRVGERALVGFPNFGYWKIRLQLALDGRMPTSPQLPFTWYDTPNIHLFTVLDFYELLHTHGIRVRQAHFCLTDSPTPQTLWQSVSGGSRQLWQEQWFNLRAASAVFELGI